MFNKCEDPDIENYADDTTPYASASSINTNSELQININSELQITASKLFTWFDNNHIKANPKKIHLLFWVPKLRRKLILLEA